MGKPTGFIEYLREAPSEISPSDRIKNWDEFHLHMPDENLQTQGARCMDCGTPFCHTGNLISYGKRLSSQQLDSRMERLGLSRTMARGT